METSIHYPTGSLLIRDGLRKILEICSKLAVGDSIVSWRQDQHLCLTRLGSKQSVVQRASANDQFLKAQQHDLGVESAIGGLQLGDGMGRCRDRSELGFELYVSLAILDRNMHTPGRRLIAAEAADSVAASTRRTAA